MDQVKQAGDGSVDTNMSQQQTVQIVSTHESSIADEPTIAGSPEQVAPSMPETLPKLPGYTIESILGRGGMGVVYQALQRPLNRPVALKMILSGEHAGAEDRLRFLAEAESIARIQHPGIVQLYEFGSHEGHPYFALEYVTGGTLEKKLSGTPLPPREAAILVEKLARAMQAAHDLGIVHRDLKPANVLLTATGEPKITDFGLAKTGGSNLTATGAILGTPSYMAPEQADGKKDVGAPADIYALGAILYECLTGRPPFKAATHLDTILQVVNSEPVSVRKRNKSVPVDLEAICHLCLAKKSKERYPSAIALADDLKRLINGESVVARRGHRIRQFARNEMSLVDSGMKYLFPIGGILLLGMFVIVLLSWLKRPVIPPTETSKQLTGYAESAKKDIEEAEKRIASIRYLATLDVARNPEAEKGLIQALRFDSVEDVRIEAARALAKGKYTSKKILEALIICLTKSNRDGGEREDSENVITEAKTALVNCISKYNSEPLSDIELAELYFRIEDIKMAMKHITKSINAEKELAGIQSGTYPTLAILLDSIHPIAWFGNLCSIAIKDNECLDPRHLNALALIQFRSGMIDEAKQTYRLLQVMIERYNTHLDTSEIDRLIGMPKRTKHRSSIKPPA